MKMEYIAGERESGTELKTILRRGLNLSAAMVKRLKQNNAIYVNGENVFTNYIAASGDAIVLDLSAAEEPSGVLPEKGEIDIIYEDEWFLALSKPSGQLTHPSRARYTGTLMNYAAGYLAEKNEGCHSVNRLDRDTSGVVLLAKNSFAKYRAIESLGEGKSKKEYIALVLGKFPEGDTVIDAPIKRLEDGKMKRGVSLDGQRAITRCRLEKSGEIGGKTVSLVRFSLETGRTHQIRVHCAYLGCPILGDRLYCSAESEELSIRAGLDSCLLHSERLGFPHPFYNKYMELTAPVKRKDFLDLMDKINGNTIDSF